MSGLRGVRAVCPYSQALPEGWQVAGRGQHDLVNHLCHTLILKLVILLANKAKALDNSCAVESC